MSGTRYTQILATFDNLDPTDFDPIYPIEVYAAYAENLSLDPINVESWQDEAEEAYAGEYDSDADFAQTLADDLDAVPANAPWPLSCIDWEYAARELMYDYFETEGYYFRNL